VASTFSVKWPKECIDSMLSVKLHPMANCGILGYYTQLFTQFFKNLLS